MQKLYALAGAATLAALILGTTAAVYLQNGPTAANCGGTVVAGGQIGGPFTLMNTAGQTVTDADVLTKPSLVYFGYGSCPDVCPLDNARNAEAADALAAQGLDVTPVFISVDPERDTPAVLKDYAANFSERLVALTGTEAQIKAAAAAYKVYYAIPDHSDAFYTVDHTTFTYLMLPGTGFVDVIDREATAADVEKRMACYIQASNS
jgi:protein SCO1